MHARIHERRAEGGFTLIELLVVMIIISILMAVAVPTFLSQKNNALKSKATANIKQIVTAMETCSAPITGGGYRQAADAITGDIAIDCSNVTTLRNVEKALTNVKIQNTAPTGDEQYQVQLSANGKGYIIQTRIEDSGAPVYFAEAHANNGVVWKRCGAAVMTVPADTATYAAPAATPIATSKTCQTGKW